MMLTWGISQSSRPSVVACDLGGGHRSVPGPHTRIPRRLHHRLRTYYLSRGTIQFSAQRHHSRGASLYLAWNFLRMLQLPRGLLGLSEGPRAAYERRVPSRFRHGMDTRVHGQTRIYGDDDVSTRGTYLANFMQFDGITHFEYWR